MHDFLAMFGISRLACYLQHLSYAIDFHMLLSAPALLPTKVGRRPSVACTPQAHLRAPLASKSLFQLVQRTNCESIIEHGMTFG